MNAGNLSFWYVLPEHGVGILADDGDMSVMFCLAEQLKVTSLEVRVKQKQSDVSSETSSLVTSSYV